MNNEMHSSSLDILALQDQEVVKNTFYRYPKVTPHINKKEDHLEIKTIDDSADIYKLDEVVLYIISIFKWSPLWLIQQWFDDYNLNGFEYVSKWIKVGIVWAETTALGVFIRPTKILLDLMSDDKQKWEDINFNLLNHTCAEEQIMFDILMGNQKSELWLSIQMTKTILFPCYHPLNIKVANEQGTIIMPEKEFSINLFKPEELEEKQKILRQSIATKANITAEFTDPTLFPIVNYDSNNNMVTQKPDLIIPVPRNQGMPQSCAIELELTAKTKEKYDNIMLNYKNNLTFGKLFYLCATRGIANLVTNAYRNVGGLGSCRLFIVPYVAPAQKLYDVRQDEVATKNIIKLSISNTKKEGN